MLIPHLAGSTIQEALANPANPQPEPIDWQTPQRAGLNFYQALPTALRHALTSTGCTLQQYKQLHLAVKCVFLEATLADMKAAAALTDSDRRSVKLAVKQTARASVKLAKAGILDAGGLALVKQLTDNLYAAARAAAISGSKFAYPPVLDMAMDARLVPHPGFDLLHDTRNTDQFAGDPEDYAPKLFVDLAEAGPKRTFEEVCSSILRAEIQTDRLRQKSSVSSPSVALHQICSLVEHLFTCVLPVPEPWTEELAASGATSPWIPTEISLTLQRAVLRALNRVCVQYVAASKSLKYDRMQSGKRIVTMAAMAAAFDAIIRLQASPYPSPVSALLHEAGDPTDAANTAGQVAQPLSPGAAAAARDWMCGECTLRNPESARSCGACGTERGGWACTKCTFSNASRSSTCVACGTAGPAGAGVFLV